MFALKREANYRQTIIFKEPIVIVTALTLAMLFLISSLTRAQQDILISGKGFDPLLNYAGVTDQVYEAWQGTVLVDVDTSDENGNYELKISSEVILTSTNAGAEYKLSRNYPEPFSDQTKLNLVIPDYTTIKIDIFNILGQRVIRQQSYSVFPGNFWMDIKGLYANGIYFVRVTLDEQSMVEKIIKLDEYSYISPSQLTKQIPTNSYNDPSIIFKQVSSITPIQKLSSELTIKVRSIGVIKYRDDEVKTNFESQILNFVRIRI
ncbi:MAG: T9SS type A sorting domain-containing protein [Ignavibacterium sp.]|nr:MAG: T9SS type A sorting domain-containing protein [Ignavibacterium sp.]